MSNCRGTGWQHAGAGNEVLGFLPGCDQNLGRWQLDIHNLLILITISHQNLPSISSGSLLIPANPSTHLSLLACDSHSFATSSSLLSYISFKRAHTSQYGFPRPAVRRPDCRRHGRWRWSWARIRRLLRQPRRERRCKRPRWQLQGRGQGLRCKSASLQSCQRSLNELAMRAFGVFSFGALGGMM